MTAFQQKKNVKKVKNISIEMQRTRFETYRGRLRFKPNYRLCAVEGSTSKIDLQYEESHSWFSRCELLSTM